MSGKTKIVVLHMKELIYTGVFVVLGILFVILMVMMFMPKGEDTGSNIGDDTGMPSMGMRAVTESAAPGDESVALTEPDGSATAEMSSGIDAESVATASGDVMYIPGIYTTELVLGEQSINVEVIVDKTSITSIRMTHLDEAVTTMYPLLQPTFDSICEQIYTQQTLEGITYSTDAKYTSLVLLEAIEHSLNKAGTE